MVLWSAEWRAEDTGVSEQFDPGRLYQVWPVAISAQKKEEGGRNARKDFPEAILGRKNDMKILYWVLCIQKFCDDTRVSFYDVNSCG